MEAFQDKVALITGSAGGLGKEFASRILRGGGRVGLSDVKEEMGQTTLKELREIYGTSKVFFMTCDVTRLTDLEKAATETCKFFGVEQLDILVNNAGVMGEKEGWKLCMDINLNGVLNGGVMAFASKMSKLNGGCGGVIVNVASILGLFNAKQPKGWAYNTSKSAVVTYTRCIGTQENLDQSGIRVLCICPSVASTPILEGCTQQELKEMEKNVGGFMTPEQVGDAFTSLLADGKTGSVMAVWKDCPSYYIPDWAFYFFVLFTTCAMVFRFVPGFSSKNTLGPIHVVLAVILIIASQLFIGASISFLFSFM